jgi:outer membrane protein OmpA-like peptidoglycan-associated protein
MTKIFTLLSILIATANFTFASNPISKYNAATSKKLIDIPLNLSAKDKRSNIQLQPKFTVLSVSGGNIVPLKEIDGRVTVIVKNGESYKITAELEGYHTKEKLQVIAADQDKEGFNVVLDMEPQPSASLILKAIDDMTGDNVEASFKVTVGDKVFNGKSSKSTPYYRMVITKAALYQVEVTTGTHKPKKESYALEIGDPARTYNKEIRLEKPLSGVKILIVGDDTRKVLKGVSLKITNTSDNQLIFDNLLPEGEAVIEFDPAKKYSAAIEQAGYTPLRLDLKANNQKEYVITLPSESFFSLGAYDRLTGKRLPANFKITYRGNTQEIKGTVEADIKFKPTEAGIYSVEVSHPNYATKNEPFNIENLSAGKLTHKITLESTVDEYVILVVDAEDKQMVGGADVKLYDENKQPVPVKLNPKTGEWKVILEKSKDYFQEVTANQYTKLTGTLQRSTSKLIALNMHKVFQTIYYSAIDAITKKPVLAQFKVIRPEQEPINGSADANKQFKVDLYPQKPYILEASAEGYKTVSENLLFDATKTEKDATKVIELQKDAYTFLFKVTDAQKKQTVTGAKIAILNLTTSQPIVPTGTDKTGFSANLVPGNNYSVSVEAEGYEKSSQNISAKDLAASNQFEQEIPLFKNAIERYKLTVLDEEKGNNVLNANLRVFNTNNEPITITANPLASEWLAELKNDESYNVEIKADGYFAYKGTLPKNSSAKTIKLKIKKVPTQEIVFAPVDALSKKSIVAEFKLLSGSETVAGTLASGGTRLKATLVQDKNYELEIISNGYKTYKDAIKLANAVNNTITLELKKESYSFNFKALDSKNKNPIPNVKVKIADTDNQAITAKYNIETQDFQANLIPDKKYKIDVEAPNYELYSEQLDITSLATSSDFKRDIFMTKKEVEKKPEPKIEPKVEAPKPVEKKVTENKVEVKVTDNAKPIEKKIEPVTPPVVKKAPEKKEPEKRIYEDNATVITDDDFKVKVEVFENLGIGKRFRLSNVYFEQGSSQIRPQSYPQLDKLVNTMKLNPKMKIEIMGHTDNNGDPRLNLNLSYFRATVVSNYIFNKGVPAERIKVTGKGQEEPIAPNDTEDNKAKNRRVEFVIREN